MITIGIAAGIIAAGAIGAVVRALAITFEGSFTRQLAGTLGINVVGSFFLGLLASASDNTMLIAGVGGLGAVTTFSTFIAQVDCLNREAQTSQAVLYAVGSLVAGVAAAYAGWVL